MKAINKNSMAIIGLAAAVTSATSVASADVEISDKDAVSKILSMTDDVATPTVNHSTIEEYKDGDFYHSVSENEALTVHNAKSETTSSDISAYATDNTVSSKADDSSKSTIYTVNSLDQDGQTIANSFTATKDDGVKSKSIDGYTYITNRVDDKQLIIDHIYKKNSQSDSQTETTTSGETTEQSTSASQSTQASTESSTNNSTEVSTTTREASNPQTSSNASSSQGLTPETTAVYVTTESAKNKNYYYMEETARANNPENKDIIRTNEKNAQAQGYQWVGEDKEPNPVKSAVPNSQTSNNVTYSASSSGRLTELPNTGTAESILSSIGMGLFATGSGLFGWVRRKKNEK